VQSGTEKTNGNAGERLVQYLARNGGQARRGQLQRSRILRGSPESYDATLASLIAEGVIVCESAGKKTETIYKLAQPHPVEAPETETETLPERRPTMSEHSKQTVRLVKPVGISSREEENSLDILGLQAVLGLEGQSGAVTIGQVTVTPAMAEILLQANKKNRPVRRPHINMLVRAIKNNEWVMTGNAISFADDEQLIDGQHRLMAIIEADRPVNCLVALGLKKAAFLTTDLGRKRGASDVAALMGFPNWTTVGSAATLLFYYDTNAIKSVHYGVSNTSIEAILKANRNGLEHSALVAKRTSNFVPAGIGAFCHFIFSRLDRDMADEFFNYLKTGAQLSQKSPLLLLRNKLFQNMGSKAKLPRLTLAAFIIKTWNRYRRGKEAVTLTWVSSEPFPQAI